MEETPLDTKKDLLYHQKYFTYKYIINTIDYDLKHYEKIGDENIVCYASVGTGQAALRIHGNSSSVKIFIFLCDQKIMPVYWNS